MFYYDNAWEASPATCPPDFDLVDLLVADPADLFEQDSSQRVLFHMGTGVHHHVGRSLSASDALRWLVIGMTAGPVEFAEYARAAIANPRLLIHYTVLFGDIYSFQPQFLVPPLDMATLFHLGEDETEERQAVRRDTYLGTSEQGVLWQFHAALTVRHGLLALYPGSTGYGRVEPHVQKMVDRGFWRDLGMRQSLRLLRAT